MRDRRRAPSRGVPRRRHGAGLAEVLDAPLHDLDPIDPLTERNDLGGVDAYDAQTRRVDHHLAGGAGIVGPEIGLQSDWGQEQLDIVGGQEDVITDVAAELAGDDAEPAEADD